MSDESCVSLSILMATRGLVTQLDTIPDLGLQRHAVETVDLLQAGRRRDVDFGAVVADHVDADEDHADPRQFGSDGLADVALALRKPGLHGVAADFDVGPGFALRRPG